MGGCIDLPLEATNTLNTDGFNIIAYHSNQMELRHIKEGSPVFLSKFPNGLR